MDPMQAVRETFFLECGEQLSELERGLMALEAGTDGPDTVGAIFRAVHSIKGGAGAFGLEALVRFAHAFETALDHVRAGRLVLDPAGLRAMLAAADVLADLVRAAHEGFICDEARVDAAASVLTALHAGLDDAAAPDEGMDDFDFVPVRVSLDPEPEAIWDIRFAPRAEMYAHANEAGLILRELGRLGVLEVELDVSALPGLAELDPNGAYLRWICSLTTAAPEAQIQEVFEWVTDDCALSISCRTAGPMPEPIDVSALLARIAAEAEEAPQAARPAQAITVPSAPAPEAGGTIRVELARVDRMMDLVGELVISQAALHQRIHVARSPEVAAVLDSLAQLTREIQDGVMAIRAQPVRSVFQRMPRLVREVAGATGKQVRLVTEGEGTEVDQSVVERLGEPLTHMIRNAIDHGLEDPARRVQAGKPAEGMVRLSALHRSGRIVIEVSDDGAGIDRDRIRAKAVERGLVAADAALSPDETDNLIFAPGFSTAACVSDISGRGVGLDVVRRSVQALGGRIAIASVPGRGSTFTLSLPLTLAVLDGMVVSVADQILVVPLGSIVETLLPRPGQFQKLGQHGLMAALRGGYVPVIDVGVALGYRTRIETGERAVALLVESHAGGRAVLLVDAIQGQQQIVMRSLETNYRAVPGIAAATVMGDGRVGLVLDVDAIVATLRAGGRVDAGDHRRMGLVLAEAS